MALLLLSAKRPGPLGGWPEGRGPQGMSATGGGGPARVPNLRAPPGGAWRTQGGKGELTSCRGTIQSAW